MKTGEPVESLSLSKFLVLYMRKYQITKVNILCHSAILACLYAYSCELTLPIAGKATLHLDPPGIPHAHYVHAT